MAHLLSAECLAASALNASAAQVASPAGPHLAPASQSVSLAASAVAAALPLYGGGFWVALLQVALVYYSTAVVLHFVIPWLLQPASIQVAPRRRGQVAEEVLNSLGAHSKPYLLSPLGLEALSPQTPEPSTSRLCLCMPGVPQLPSPAVS